MSTMYETLNKNAMSLGTWVLKAQKQGSKVTRCDWMM